MSPFKCLENHDLWDGFQVPSFEETLRVLKEAPPDRIGHGTFLHRYDSGSGHEEIEELVLKHRIPIGRGPLSLLVWEL